LDPNLFPQECTKISLIQEKWSLKKAQVFMQSSFLPKITKKEEEEEKKQQQKNKK
jgi:hypothetical protein